MPYVNAKNLNRKITIQERSSTRDTWGTPVGEWVDVLRTWGDIRFATGLGLVANERISANAEISRSAASIRIKGYRPNLHAGMRVKHGELIYEIRDVALDEQSHRFTDLIVAHGANEG